MKRCPTCDKTFDDNLRFCQSCGSPLADAVEELDPYKTMVARPEDIAAAIPPLAEPELPAPAEDVLELPSDFDANKTQIVSESELRAEFEKANDQVIDVPAPEPPKFIAPDPPAPPAPPVASPPPAPEPPKAAEPPPASPSPFSNDLTGDPFMHTTPPIPSPFEKATPPTPEPKGPRIVEPAAPAPEPPSPFGTPLAQAEVPAPVAAEPVWEDKNDAFSGSVSAPAEGVPGKQNKTLAIVSLILGILGLLCCSLLLPSIVAIITGFMARGKAKNDPENYGGSGMAVGGILTGLLGFLLGVAYLIFLFAFNGMETLMRGM